MLGRSIENSSHMTNICWLSTWLDINQTRLGTRLRRQLLVTSLGLELFDQRLKMIHLTACSESTTPPPKTNNSFSANPHQSSFPRFNQADSVSTCTRQQLDNVEGTLVQSASLMTEALWGSHAKGVSSLCLKGSRGMETVQEYRNYTGISGTEIFRFYWCASLKYAYISRVIKFN